MSFESCKHCEAPIRHPGCHKNCPEYLRDKELLDRRNERIRREKDRTDAITCAEIESKERYAKRFSHGISNRGARKRYLHER